MYLSPLFLNILSAIKNIKSPILDEIEKFEEKFRSSLKSDVSLLNKIMYYIIKRKGKQMRPMFVFLSAKIFGDVKEETYRAASMIELLHTATLVHDDVIDESNFRRGFFSINALWKNKVAVLVGDFLLSKGLILAVKNKDYELLEIVNRAVEEMSEGELLQIEKSRDLNISEDIYFEIIRKKTATLISACCESGVNSVLKDQNILKKMSLFGEKAGIAFQMTDDLFDYTNSPLIGKPVGIDIRERKITLPLIYTLNIVNKETNKYLINIIKNHNKNQKYISEIIEIVKENGGVDYTKDMIKKYHDEALEILNEFPDNEAKKSLILLLEFVIKRKK